jgi:hypothetical protein
MIQEKICKGVGITSGYGCGKMVNVCNRKYGLGKMCCYPSWLLESENGKIKMQKAILKASKPKFDKVKAKENTTDWNKKLQTKINEIVRLIDKGQPCLAKGIHAKQMHAGHVFSRGSNPMLRFNLHNIHRQSAQSNHFQNEDGLFREGIVKEYGHTYFNFISELRQIKDLKITNDEYIGYYKKASKIVLDLKKMDVVYAIDVRLLLRDKINQDLGIYNYGSSVFNKNVFKNSK